MSDPKTTVIVDFDDKENPEIMKISLPIKHFSENEIGTVLVKGFMDDIKEMALGQIRKSRIKKTQEEAKILVPKQPVDLIVR